MPLREDVDYVVIGFNDGVEVHYDKKDIRVDETSTEEAGLEVGKAKKWRWLMITVHLNTPLPMERQV